MKNEVFYFTKTERIGVVFLVILLIGTLLVPEFFPIFFKKEERYLTLPDSLFASGKQRPSADSGLIAQPFFFDPNKVDRETLQKWGISSRLASTWVHYRQKVKVFRRREDLKNIYGMTDSIYGRLAPWLIMEAKSKARFQSIAPKTTDKSFPFDPNKTSIDSLALLGFSERLIQQLDNYRKKGGRFRKKEDLLRLYAMDTTLFRLVEPFIAIPSSSLRNNPDSLYRANDGSSTKYQTKLTVEAADLPELIPELVDINRSDSEDWQRLHGIGPYFARQIIRFRKALGGFYSVDQVGETYRLPDSVFHQIKPFLIVSAPVEGIRINQVGADSLARHPYISGRLAGAIVAWRDQHGLFKDTSDLKKVQSLSNENRKKITPYIRFH